MKNYKFFNAVPWNSMELGVCQFRWHKQFHWIPWNSMELENRMKNNQLNIFSGLPNLALFWAVRQIFLVFQHPRSLIYANSDFWCSVDAPMCKCFAIMCGTEVNGYVLAKLCPFNIYSTYFDRVFVTCQNFQFWQVCSSDGLSVSLFVCLFVCNIHDTGRTVRAINTKLYRYMYLVSG